MEEIIIEFFKNTVEVKSFGLNAKTISALMIVVLSTYQMWGVSQQFATIRRKESAESISLPFFIFTFFYMTATIMYGIYTDKLSVIYNGLNAFFFLAVLLIAWRYKKITGSDIWSLILFSLIIPIMIMVNDKKVAYMSCASLTFLLAFFQLKLLIKKGKRGSLEPKLINVYVVTNSAWLVYGIITKDWVFELSSSIGLALLIIIAILLRVYKDS